MGPRFDFQLPANWTRTELFLQLRQEFSFQLRPPQRMIFKYYDCFDWRLYQKQMMLIWDGIRLFLMHTAPAYAEITCRYDREPKYVQDLPEGQLRNKLFSVTEYRALLPVLAIKKEAQPVKFLNQQDKTVCDGFYEKNSVFSGRTLKRLKPVFCLVPLKGYWKWNEQISGWLQKNGCQPMRSDIYYLALQKVRIIPGRYTSKVLGALSAEINIQQAARMILKQQLSVLSNVEPGIHNETDTEFLHDFRVAIRRLRSLLGNLREYIGESVYRKTKTVFTFLIKLTNSCRDLDIFLQRQAFYLQLLPPRYRMAASHFFADLRVKREKEHKRIVRYLTSREYPANKLYWNNLVLKKSALFRRMGRGSLKVQAVAEIIIHNRYKKVICHCRRLPAQPSDEFLHRLRIECKKLRYALEFFHSLFNFKSVRSMIKKLRELQDTLGEYNDLRLQQRRLQTYLRNRNRRKPPDPPKVSGALNFLLTKIQRRKNELQVIFRNQFTEFCRPERQQAIFKIFPDTKNL
jgi:CHAD domain-containing protein